MMPVHSCFETQALALMTSWATKLDGADERLSEEFKKFETVIRGNYLVKR
jgi:hypothetical protein